jgi:hypothetical protein
VRPNLALYAIALVSGLAAYWFCWNIGQSTDETSIVGTWTDAAGPPGNSIRFYVVESDIPGIESATVLDGHLTLVNFLGKSDDAGTWGYGSRDPLALNLTVNGRPMYAAIRMLDDEHLLARFGTVADEIYGPDALNHPDTRVLTRIGREEAP